MNEDVEKLRERYNQLAFIASSNNKAIGLNSMNIATKSACARSCFVF